MRVGICKWYNDADSPVLLMIDDLANTWVDTNHNGSVDEGEDWGYFKNEEYSSFRFLNEKILNLYPKVKVTFFVPVGTRAGMLVDPLFPQISKPINSDDESKQFFRSVHEYPHFELAYHGTTHGTAGHHAVDFVQEWAAFNSVDEAVDTVRMGMTIFEDAIGEHPRGGKYCGYTSNVYSDESINETGFTWWCRYWNRGISEGVEDMTCGSDNNPLTNFDVKRFGSNSVIDIPSTVNGELLNGLYRNDPTVKGRMKRILRKPLQYWKLRQIAYLLKHRLVISVQEHMAPSRDDGKRQNPNIIDDRESLLAIFRYLENKNVWYCTGSELANYVNLRDHVEINFQGEHTFTLKHETAFANQTMSLKFEEEDLFQILLPNQSLVRVQGKVVNLPVIKGEYTMIRR